MSNIPIENASPEVQLAVELIYLLECNNVSPQLALAALELVRHDYQSKLAQNTSPPAAQP